MRKLLPRPTLRLRLTLLYGGLFLAAGTVLLVITYELVAHSPSSTGSASFVVAPNNVAQAVAPSLGPPRFLQSASPVPGGPQLRAYAGQVNKTFRKLTATQQGELHKLASRAKVVLHEQQSSQLDALLTRSGIALGIMAIISIGLGWLIAGRALRPVRTMNARARGISERNLHERLALDGPDDELKELGDTFDELLARLESAFDSQRQFVANASHELRTPITLERALVEVALADSALRRRTFYVDAGRIVQVAHGRTWLLTASGGHPAWLDQNGGLHWLGISGASTGTRAFVHFGAAISAVIADSNGCLWIGTAGDGVLRVPSDPHAPVQHYTRNDGLSSGFVRSIFEDREHNIWVATEDGLNSLRRNQVLVLTRRDGLISNHVNSIAAENDGSVWLATADGLQRLAGGQTATYRSGVRILSLLMDGDYQLWAGSSDRVF